MARLYWIALQTLWIKEVTRFSRIWLQTLMPPVITMTLYFIIFGNFLGDHIGEMSGVSYIQFIAPGLIMMSVITNSYSNVISSFFSAKFQRNIEELLVAPIPTHIIIWGYIGGGIARGLVVGALVSVVALFFIDLHVHAWWIVITTLLLTTILFSLAGLLNAIYARSFDDITIVPNFILTPLTYLGGVFYSIYLLPPVWQYVTKVNPIVYMISGFRAGFLGVSDVPLTLTFSVLFAFIIIIYGFVWYLIEKGIGLRS